MIAGSASPIVEQETPPVRAGGVLLVGDVAGGGAPAAAIGDNLPESDDRLACARAGHAQASTAAEGIRRLFELVSA